MSRIDKLECLLLVAYTHDMKNIVLVCISIDRINIMAKSNMGRKQLLQFTMLRQYSIMEGSQSRVVEARSEEEPWRMVL